MYHLCQLFGMIKADKGWSKRKEGDWASPLRIVYSYNSDCLTVAWWWKAWELSCQLPGGFTSSNVATSEVPLQVRRQRLLSNWGFLCKCSRCEAEDLWPRLRFIFGPKHTSKMGNFWLTGGAFSPLDSWDLDKSIDVHWLPSFKHCQYVSLDKLELRAGRPPDLWEMLRTAGRKQIRKCSRTYFSAIRTSREHARAICLVYIYITLCKRDVLLSTEPTHGMGIQCCPKSACCKKAILFTYKYNIYKLYLISTYK